MVKALKILIVIIIISPIILVSFIYGKMYYSSTNNPVPEEIKSLVGRVRNGSNLFHSYDKDNGTFRVDNYKYTIIEQKYKPVGFYKTDKSKTSMYIEDRETKWSNSYIKDIEGEFTSTRTDSSNRTKAQYNSLATKTGYIKDKKSGKYKPYLKLPSLLVVSHREFNDPNYYIEPQWFFNGHLSLYYLDGRIVHADFVSDARIVETYTYMKTGVDIIVNGSHYTYYDGYIGEFDKSPLESDLRYIKAMVGLS